MPKTEFGPGIRTTNKYCIKVDRGPKYEGQNYNTLRRKHGSIICDLGLVNDFLDNSANEQVSKEKK